MARKQTPEGRVIKAVSTYLALQESMGHGTWWVVRNMTWNANAGCMIKSHNPINKNGLSDIMGIYRGRFFAIECKSAVGRQSLAQRQFQEMVETSGGIYLLCRGVEDVETIFNSTSS